MYKDAAEFSQTTKKYQGKQRRCLRGGKMGHKLWKNSFD